MNTNEFSTPQDVPQETAQGNFEQKEKMVDAIKITAIFSDAKVLEKIADSLLSKGLISGFHIDNIHGGYLYEGKKVEQGQYALEILLEQSAGSAIKDQIREIISEEIKKQWDVPIIEEENVKINENMLSFIKRAEVEHKKYEFEKKLRLSVSLAALLSVSGLIAMFADKYVEKKEQDAVMKDRQKIYLKVQALQQDIQNQVIVIERKLNNEGKLTVAQNDMSAGDSYEETEKLQKFMRDVEFEIRKLADK